MIGRWWKLRGKHRQFTENVQKIEVGISQPLPNVVAILSYS